LCRAALGIDTDLANSCFEQSSHRPHNAAEHCAWKETNPWPVALKQRGVLSNKSSNVFLCGTIRHQNRVDHCGNRLSADPVEESEVI
jgi:hypothetical protein